MSKSLEQTTLKNPEEFFTNPKESKIIEEAKLKIFDSENGVLDQDQLREQEDWNYLAGKIVGAETG